MLGGTRGTLVGLGLQLDSTNHDSETYFGIGDLVVRGRWTFLVGIAKSNHDGLHTTTYRPRLVVSRDLDTAIGGLGLQGHSGCSFRPDEPDQQRFDRAVGAALQPLGRASTSLDLLGNDQTRGARNSMIDDSVGLKLALAQDVPVDFNWIAPLDNDGFRPSAGIFSFQIEGVLGD